MTLAVGTDIVEIDRIRNVYERQGERLVQRILTPNEQVQYGQFSQSERKIAYLAKRWCAKEAVAKALGTGIAQGVGFQQIEIQNNEQGAPEVQLTQGALQQLTKLGAKKALISISDERHYAVAFCTLV